MKVLITGGMGFIGSNYVRYHLKTHPNDEITVLDKLTYAGRKENLQSVMDQIDFNYGDICDPDSVASAAKNCEQIIHFAAESHVDRSIDNSRAFLRTNVEGTGVLLDAARDNEVERFIQISTDEVYGSITNGSFRETDPLSPSSPYSASKAAGDLLALAYQTTYRLPVIITRSTNNYGPYQHVEKLIPLMITRALQDKPLPVYGSGLNIRDWTYVEDNCAAIDCVRKSGDLGEIYNIGSHQEWTNIDIVKEILHILEKPESLITYVQDRPGHDLRYSVQIDKIKSLGWEPRAHLKEGLMETINWYRDNRSWWETHQ